MIFRTVERKLIFEECKQDGNRPSLICYDKQQGIDYIKDWNLRVEIVYIVT